MNVLPMGIQAFTGRSAQGHNYGDRIDLRQQTRSAVYVSLYVYGTGKGVQAISRRSVAPKSVKTPYGPAVQEQSAAALRVRSQIQQGGTVYKGGVLGRSETGASQFLATESPLNPGYAGRYGIPPQNAHFDFIMGGRVRPGAPVITRSAPGIPPNPGGGIEGVINSGDLMIDWFHMP
jgi:hypothetical protein